jgi:succinyl-CoA synthetase alpha subunit
MEVMRQAGVVVCEGPHLLGQAMQEALARRTRPRGPSRAVPRAARKARAARPSHAKKKRPARRRTVKR